MKKIFYLASIICLALSSTSCEDFLTVESPDELTTDNYWRNEQDAQAGLAAAIHNSIMVIHMQLVKCDGQPKNTVQTLSI